jgi:chromosome partitioning protein
MNTSRTSDTPALDRMALDRVIAIANGKGGVGKTSTTANVGGLLGEAGYKVLLVDWDSQANLSDSFGLTDTDEGQGALESLLTGKPLVPVEGVRENVDLVTAGEYTDDISSMIDSDTRRRRQSAEERMNTLAMCLGPLADKYDITLVDCPPKEPVLQELALVASRYLLIPTKSDANSRKGLRLIGQRWQTAKQFNPTLELLGVLLFGSNPSATRLQKETRDLIAADLGSDAPILTTVVRHVEKIATTASNRGVLIHELEQAKATETPWYERLRLAKAGNKKVDSEGNQIGESVHGLAEDYQALTEEIVNRLAALQEDSK